MTNFSFAFSSLSLIADPAPVKEAEDDCVHQHQQRRVETRETGCLPQPALLLHLPNQPLWLVQHQQRRLLLCNSFSAVAALRPSL